MPINIITGREISESNSVYSDYHGGYIRADQAAYLRDADGQSIIAHESAVIHGDGFIVGNGSLYLAEECTSLPHLAVNKAMHYRETTPRNIDLYRQMVEGFPSGEARTMMQMMANEIADNVNEPDNVEIELAASGEDVVRTYNTTRGLAYHIDALWSSERHSSLRFVHAPFLVGEEVTILPTPFLVSTSWTTRNIIVEGDADALALYTFPTSKGIFHAIANSGGVVADGSQRAVFLSADEAVAAGQVPSVYACDYHASHDDSKFRRYNRDQLHREEVKYRVGFEIEKVDKKAKYLMSQKGFKYDLPSGGRLVVEQDSSLRGVERNRGGGFEAVTTIYDLFSNDIETDVEDAYFTMVLDAKGDSINPHGTNGERNFEAGGHVNLSVRGMSVEELNSKLLPFSGLLFAIHARNLRRYASYQSARNFQRGSCYDGTPAFETKSSVIELRLFGPVRDKAAFLTRVELLRAICELIESGQVKNYLDVNRILRNADSRLARAAVAEFAIVEEMFALALGEDQHSESQRLDVLRKRAMFFSAAMETSLDSYTFSTSKYGVFADKVQKQLAEVYDALPEITKARMQACSFHVDQLAQ